MLKLTLIAVLSATAMLVISREIARETRPSVAEASTAGREPTRGSHRVLDWKTLRELNLSTGAVPVSLQSAHGAKVAVPGYVVPLDDDANSVSEFLLVPYFGACVHVPPPPPNQMILVRIAGGKSIAVPYGAIWMHGTLQIVSGSSPYGKVAYQMDGSHIEPFLD